MFNKTIRLLNRRTTKSLVVDERVKLNLAERESIPPKPIRSTTIASPWVLH